MKKLDKLYFSDCQPDRTMLEYICSQPSFDLTQFENQKLAFYEFALSDLNLPDSNLILEKINVIKSKLGQIYSWRKNGENSEFYKGFSLTYNKNFIYPEQSIHSQTLGDYKLTQTFSRDLGTANLHQIRDSYYDTYAFRYKSDLIKTELGFLIDKMKLDLSRSRCASMFGGPDTTRDKINFHKDECPLHLLRINIPLQTSEDYVLEINGEDDFGQKLKLIRHLRPGYAYIWNTRIPHRVYTTSHKVEQSERIHLVLGLMPWIKFSDNYQAVEKNDFWGTELDQLINNLVRI